MIIKNSDWEYQYGTSEGKRTCASSLCSLLVVECNFLFATSALKLFAYMIYLLRNQGGFKMYILQSNVKVVHRHDCGFGSES